MAVTHPTPTAAPRRGRPPRLSREQIVEAVAEMLLSDPTAPLTIARAAEAVGAAPMSLYRHFADRDDLVAAVAHHVFAGTRPQVDATTPWQEVVRAWMTAVYEQARRVPRLMQLIASGEAPEWLPDASYLAATFERAGVNDDRRIMEATYWIATSTMGHAMIQSAKRQDVAAANLRAGLERLSGDDAERMSRLIPHLNAIHEDAFERVIGWTIAGLEAMLTTADA